MGNGGVERDDWDKNFWVIGLVERENLNKIPRSCIPIIGKRVQQLG